MLTLIFLWLALGLVIGALGLAARLRPAAWGRWNWLLLPGVGLLAALLGGMLGTWLLGRLYGTLTALWVAVLLVALVPWLAERWRRRAARR